MRCLSSAVETFDGDAMARRPRPSHASQHNTLGALTRMKSPTNSERSSRSRYRQTSRNAGAAPSVGSPLSAFRFDVEEVKRPLGQLLGSGVLRHRLGEGEGQQQIVFVAVGYESAVLVVMDGDVEHRQ